LKDTISRHEAVPTEVKRRSGAGLRVLTLSTVDITLDKLLLPLIRALRDEGFVSECASADGTHAEMLRDMGFVVHPISFKRRLLTTTHITAFFQVYRLLRRRSYQIVHVHTPFAQVIGRVAARLAGVPLVFYTSHGFQFYESRSRLACYAIARVEQLLGKWTDMLFTQSREDAETAVRIGIAPKERVLWIGNGVQLDRFQPGPPTLDTRREFDLDANHRVVGFIGRIVREKGIEELIEAMAYVTTREPDARLLVVGDTLASDGDTEAKKVVQRAILEYGMQDKVRFAGLRDDIPRLLKALDIFVLPSWREGMPRSIIEAMATGLPVVATDIRGCREEVIHGESGLLVPPRNPRKLGEAILSLVCDDAQAKRMGKRGRELALEWFNEDAVIERQIEAYHRLIAERSLGR
jgi:glycosyltransferase involved in cell wall biosynthesis